MTDARDAELAFEPAGRRLPDANRPAPVAVAPHPLVRLQQQAGNAAVARLVQRLQDGAVQRAAELQDDEMEIGAKHDRSLRRVGDDDEMANAGHGEGGAGGALGLAGGPLSEGAASRIDSLRGGGSTLHDGLRASAEGSLGVDLSAVRVHQNAASDSLARGMTAKAFTSGSDVFLRGDMNPGDSRLIGHELAHVAQQSSGGVAPTGQRMTVGPADDPLEHQADNVADAISSGSTANREMEDG